MISLSELDLKKPPVFDLVVTPTSIRLIMPGREVLYSYRTVRNSDNKLKLVRTEFMMEDPTAEPEAKPEAKSKTCVIL